MTRFSPTSRIAVALLLAGVAVVAGILAFRDSGASGASCESSAEFEGGFESAEFEEWRNVQALPGRATVDGGDPFCGDRHGRFEVRPGDVEPQTESNRAELTGPSFSDGDDLWYRVATQLEDGFPDGDEFQIVTQWRSGDASPPLALFAAGGELELRDGGEPFTEFWEGPAPTGEWIDLIVRIRFSNDSSTGFVEVWRDGRRQTLANGEERMHGQTIDGDSGDVKLGYYRSSDHEDTGVVLHDNFLIGDSLSDVTRRP